MKLVRTPANGPLRLLVYCDEVHRKGAKDAKNAKEFGLLCDLCDLCALCVFAVDFSRIPMPQPTRLAGALAPHLRGLRESGVTAQALRCDG